MLKRINALRALSSVQFTSVYQSSPTLCNSMDCSTSGFPVHHQLLEFTQNHIHWVGNAIQTSHPLSSPYPRTFNLSQHQGLYKWVSSSHQVAKVLEFQQQSSRKTSTSALLTMPKPLTVWITTSCGPSAGAQTPFNLPPTLGSWERKTLVPVTVLKIEGNG